MKNHLVGAIILLLALLLIGVAPVFAIDTIEDGTMPTQGFLAGPGGLPVPDGQYMITFSIHNDSLGGALLWEETQTVTTTGGMFSVRLGTVNAIPDSAISLDTSDTTKGRFLQITVNGEPLLPRTPMGSTPFARFSRGINGHVVTRPSALMVPDTAGNERIQLSAAADIPSLVMFNWFDHPAVEFKADTGGGRVTLYFREIDSFREGIEMKADATGGQLTLWQMDDSPALIIRDMADSMKTAITGTGIILKFGALNGYVLTSDADGNGTWQPPAGGGSCWQCPGHYTILSDINDSVGIGTATPTAKLEVAGDIRSTTRGIFGPGSGVSGTASFAAGDNCHATADWTSVGGGHDNNASALGTVVAGGNTNSASTSGAAVLGGYLNVAGGTDAAVGGGAGNQALGPRSAIPGGYANNVTGGTSFAAGDQCNVSGNWSAALGSLCEATANLTYAIGNRAEAHHAGAVVISANSSTSSLDTISSGGGEQMVLRADSGFFLGKSVNFASIPGTDFLYTSTGAHLTNGGAWTNACDVNAKENFAAVNGADVLARLASLAITEWNYKVEDPSIRHIGPTAQDFRREFGVGSDDKSISTIDPAGIALVAIKELDRRTTELSAMSSRVQQLEAQIAALQALVAKLVDEKR